LTTQIFGLLDVLREGGFDRFARRLIDLASPSTFVDAYTEGWLWEAFFSWVSLLVAFIAGLVTRHFFTRRDRMETESPRRAADPGFTRSASGGDRGRIPDRDPRSSGSATEGAA
jgi:hypothetical protein